LAQRYRNIVAALPLECSSCEFATMSVQYMFYGSDLQHRSIVLEDINIECFQYDDDIKRVPVSRHNIA
jgi:hypothetical protein